MQMLSLPDVDRAREQHMQLAATYEAAGISVHWVAPPLSLTVTPTPNQLFVADLFVMTPEGAIVGRPASTVRAGEERWVARRLADLGIPILRAVRGYGTFEGADAMWLDAGTVLLGRGLRTNDEGARQVTATLHELGIEVVQVELPFGTMHLMGQLRILDRDLALVWPHRLAYVAVEVLRQRGYQLILVPDEEEASSHSAINVVTLGPRELLMPAGCPRTQSFLERYGVTCHTVEISGLAKAAGGIGCMTGILSRQADA
jgi:N-dimethylarginine dimethylaminohydrolase